MQRALPDYRVQISDVVADDNSLVTQDGRILEIWMDYHPTETAK